MTTAPESVHMHGLTDADIDATHDALWRLARNLRWAWRDEVRGLFTELDAAAFEAAERDPARLLRTVGRDAVATAMSRAPGFAVRAAAAAADLAQELSRTDTWYARSGGRADAEVAYFSAEFAIADPLHTYSGGLGVLAGDHLRSASDLGVPLVAIGLAYRDGYFAQYLDASGWQLAEPARTDYQTSCATRVVGPDGQPMTVVVRVAERDVTVAAWQVQVGRVPLYLLDTDLDANHPDDREITSQLYGGGSDLRLRQELILGVGGVRLLAALDRRPDVIHLNEGHAAFAAVERLRVLREAGLSWHEAVVEVRGHLVFTTHTPVIAGHDVFGPDQAAWYLTSYAEGAGVAFDELAALARQEGNPDWSQTVLACSLAHRVNGVARLHGEVSRRMWGHLWPGVAPDAVPITHVTNGVHPGLWIGPKQATLYDQVLGTGWRGDAGDGVFAAIREAAPAAIWEVREAARAALLAVAREHLATQATRTGMPADGAGLRDDALTIGFARRFATYKRATLLLHDVDRLAGILASNDRPVQVLVAGKAHPADEPGKLVLQQLVQLSRDPRLVGRIAFLEGYDLDLARMLVTGVDVWLNTPLRPLEASGTSGMKAAMNGVLNLSILDGWWDEAVTDHRGSSPHGFGWAIGDLREDGDRGERDAADAASLYRLLEDEIVPTFYEREADGVSYGWVARMQESVAMLAPFFSTHRMVADYTRTMYELVR